MEKKEINVSNHKETLKFPDYSGIEEYLPKPGQSMMNYDTGTYFLEHQNLTAELQKQLHMKDDIIRILQEENKLQRGRLKGYETLAGLYQQSKNECTRLSKQCAEQVNMIEDYRTKCHSFDTRQVETFAVISGTENISSENLHSVEKPKCNCEISKSPSVRDSQISFEKDKLSLVQSFCVEESGPKDSETVDLKEVEETGDEAAGYGCSRNQDNCSLLEVPLNFSSMKDRTSIEDLNLNSLNNETNDEEHEDAQDRECRSKMAINDHSSHECRDLEILRRHLRNPEASEESKNFLVELLSVGAKLINLDEQVQQQEADNNLSAPEVPHSNNLSAHNVSHSSRDLNTEVQILQEQVMTFKYDFNEERKDRVKARSKYDLLKSKFDRLYNELCDLKVQNKIANEKLQDIQKENTILKHQIHYKHIDETKKHKPTCHTVTSVNHHPSPERVPPTGVSKTWPCIRCTYENPYTRQTCELCGMEAFSRTRLHFRNDRVAASRNKHDM